MIVANRVTSRICEPFSAKEARPLNLRSKIVKSGTPMSRRIVTSPIWGKARISWGVVPAISIPEISMAKGPMDREVKSVPKIEKYRIKWQSYLYLL